MVLLQIIPINCFNIHFKTHIFKFAKLFINSLHHIKCPGAILHPGTLVARLDLDDPSSVCQAKLHTDPLPVCRTGKMQGCKVHQVYTVYSMHIVIVTCSTVMLGV